MISQSTIESSDTALKCSKLVHPEDLVVGDSVVVSARTHQLASFFWCGVDSFQFPPDELIELTFLAVGNHYPQSVKSICLPFVLCQRIDKTHVVHDLRRLQLARLDESYAKAVRKAYKADKKRKAQKKRKSKKKNRK